MKWYKKSGWIIFFLIIFCPVGIFLTWKYSSWKKVSKIILSVVFGGLFIIGVSTSLNSHSTIENSNSSVTFADKELTSDTVKDAISNLAVKNKVTDVKINNGTVTVIVYDKENWNPQSYLESNQTNSARVFHDLFANKKISTIVYQSDVNVTDAYGKSSRVTAQTNTMKRADANKISDWNNFSIESPSQFYSVVNFKLAPESKVSGLHTAWVQYYK